MRRFSARRGANEPRTSIAINIAAASRLDTTRTISARGCHCAAFFASSGTSVATVRLFAPKYVFATRKRSSLRHRRVIFRGIE